MKFLTLNLFKGKCLPNVLSFLEEEHFDLIHLQEVSGKGTGFAEIDCFEALKKSGLKGELLASWNLKNNQEAYFGNATFFHPSFKLQERRAVWLWPFHELENPEKEPHLHPRTALLLRLSDGSKEFWSINTHLAWGPTPEDTPYKIVQAQTLAEEIGKLEFPFILSGDFNVVKETKVVKILTALGNNLTHDVTNTLNPRLHRAKALFPPGLGVDFIITSQGFKSDNLHVLENLDLSDHLGISVELF